MATTKADILRELIIKKLPHIGEDTDWGRFETEFLIGELENTLRQKIKRAEVKSFLRNEMNLVSRETLDALVTPFGFGRWRDFTERVPSVVSIAYLEQIGLRRFDLWNEFFEDPEKDTAIGTELAYLVLEELKKGKVLVYTHRDYCGMGLGCYHGIITYFRATDSSTETILEFKEDSTFINWLAIQTNRSLSGEEEDFFLRYNQRLTRKRLMAFGMGE